MARTCLYIILCLSCLASCTRPQVPPTDAFSSSLPNGASAAGGTVTEARKLNWNCQQIERTIKKLVTAMQAEKTRAEKEQEEVPQTLALMLARLSGPPGTGNAALIEFQKISREVDELNALLKEKGCAIYPIGVDAPRFLAIVTASNATGGSKDATISIAEKIADGHPWKVNMVERKLEVEMTLFPDGSGVANHLDVATAEWRPNVNGLCMKTSEQTREHCFTFLIRPSGYDAIEDGKLYLEFRR